MHSSVLQNDKYIEFANDNTVEVIAEQRVDEGRQKKDPKADEYDAKDEKGNPVKYMKEWPNLTYDEIIALNGSPAGQYNKTGKIPYISIVDPYTLAEMKGLAGGQSAKGVMEAVTEAKAQLAKDHGPSLKRSVLQKFDASAKAVDDTLTKGGAAKAMADYRKLEASVAKEGEGIKTKAKALETKILDAAKMELDKAEQQIAAGDLKSAAAALNPLAKALKGTDLYDKASQLLEKTKAEAPPK